MVGALDAFGVAGHFNSFCFYRFFEPSAYECGSWAGEGNLTLHGLWPNYKTEHSGHDWPQFCNATSDPEYYATVSVIDKGVRAQWNPRWREYAPGWYTENMQAENLADHEWAKHGTCYSEAIYHDWRSGAFAEVQARYFTVIHRLVREHDTPPQLIDARRRKHALSIEELQAMFGGPAGSVALSCHWDADKGKQRLTGVTLCFGHDSNGDPTRRQKCDPMVLSADYDNGCVVGKHGNVSVLVDAACK